MYCKDSCEYKNIKKIILHNFVLDICDKCNYCSISISEYFDFLNQVIISNHLFNINLFTIVDAIPKNEQNKYNDFLNYFLINLNHLKKCEKYCRICGDILSEEKKSKNFSIYFCNNCMHVYFEKNLFNKYLKKKIKIFNNFYFLIYMYKRFLQLFKRGKNNVKK